MMPCDSSGHETGKPTFYELDGDSGGALRVLNRVTATQPNGQSCRLEQAVDFVRDRPLRHDPFGALDQIAILKEQQCRHPHDVILAS